MGTGALTERHAKSQRCIQEVTRVVSPGFIRQVVTDKFRCPFLSLPSLLLYLPRAAEPTEGF